MKKLNLIIVCMVLFVGISVGQTKVEPTTTKAEKVEGLKLTEVKSTNPQTIEAKEYDGKTVNTTPVKTSTDQIKSESIDLSKVKKTETTKKTSCTHATKKTSCTHAEKKTCTKAEQKKCSHATKSSDQ